MTFKQYILDLRSDKYENLQEWLQGHNDFLETPDINKLLSFFTEQGAPEIVLREAARAWKDYEVIITGKIGAPNIVIHAKEKVFYSANVLKVTVGTTGLCGGDTGHGCRTFLAITDEGSTDITGCVIGGIGGDNGGIALMLGGDCELLTLIDGLQFAVDTLKAQVDGGG